MNINEIYVLNVAVGGGEIFSLPRVSKSPRSALLFDAAIEGLAAKGLMKNATCFTMDGLRIAKRILDYKKSKKHVKIGSMTIGIQENGTGVLLRRDVRTYEYDFVHLVMREQAQCLWDAYPTLGGANAHEEAPPRSLTYAEVNEAFHTGIHNCVYLSTITRRGAHAPDITNEMVFASDGQLYLYDRDEGRLYRRSGSAIKELIRERLAI
jgi:hypothetical protein